MLCNYATAGKLSGAALCPAPKLHVSYAFVCVRRVRWQRVDSMAVLLIEKDQWRWLFWCSCNNNDQRVMDKWYVWFQLWTNHSLRVISPQQAAPKGIGLPEFARFLVSDIRFTYLNETSPHLTPVSLYAPFLCLCLLSSPSPFSSPSLSREGDDSKVPLSAHWTFSLAFDGINLNVNDAVMETLSLG